MITLGLHFLFYSSSTRLLFSSSFIINFMPFFVCLFVCLDSYLPIFVAGKDGKELSPILGRIVDARPLMD